MNFQQASSSTQVPKRDTLFAKTTLVAMATFLSLTMTACTDAFIHHPGRGSLNDGSVVKGYTGGPTVPEAPAPAASTVPPQAAAAAPAAAAEVVSPMAKRVALVVDWLRFINQRTTADLVTTGWEKVLSGHADPLPATLPALPDAAIPAEEYWQWYRILEAGALGRRVRIVQFNDLTLLLTMARNPDDLAQVDKLILETHQFEY